MITIAELRPGHLRLGASHIRRLNCLYNRLGLHTIDRLLIDPVKAVSYQRINLPPIYPSPYQCLDTVRLWNGEDNPMIVNCCSDIPRDNISPSWIAPLCVCTYQELDTSFPPVPSAAQCPGHRMVGDLGPLCPPSHMRGGADTGTQHKQVSHASWRTHTAGTETANTLQWWPVWQPDIRDTVSRDCHAGVSCHYIVTSSSPGQRSRHYPDKIISDIWICWMHQHWYQMKVQSGKLFFRIDSMCNSVKCDTPCFMEWCHATNLSSSPVCSMSETLGCSANFIYINVSSFNRSKHLCQFNRFIVFGLGIHSHFQHVGYAMIHMFENIFTRQFCKVSDISL